MSLLLNSMLVMLLGVSLNSHNSAISFQPYDLNGLSVSASFSNLERGGKSAAATLLVVLDSHVDMLGKRNVDALFSGISEKRIEELTKITNSAVYKAISKENTNSIYRIDVSDIHPIFVNTLIERFKKNDHVLAVEVYGSAKNEPTSNDAEYNGDPGQWGLKDGNGIKADQVWSHYTTGSSSVRVGVIDSGIADHPDLRQNIVSGYDFVNNDSTTSDDFSGHGTHVAGIIGAVGNNGIGIAGVNWKVSLVPLQTIDSGNKHDPTALIKAINYATNKWNTHEQIDILNYSVSDFGNSVSVRSAVQNFPGLFVWAAGNENKDIDEYIDRNGSFNLSNLISVGAINVNGARWIESNYSAEDGNVNIYAPGEDIVSTDVNQGNNEYGKRSGTSMAAPFVSGTAALLHSYNSTISGKDLKTALLDAADDIYVDVPISGGLRFEAAKRLNAIACFPPLHSHSYGHSYAWRNDTYHWAYCECGQRISEYHVISSSSAGSAGSKTCLLCNGEANKGITIPSYSPGVGSSQTDRIYFGKRSYLSLEGVYVLSKEDEDLLNQDSLDLPHFDEGVEEIKAKMENIAFSKQKKALESEAV